eukprot:CAMPEP_0114428894 /NCGR_PEP_ID=MMETSP0103-20121206/9185_1 /TAXON_ID=37642 ORGANISM="Paraphysomonas imperforata, Strain PA2" /NCGR_SAMPLE_ID=MMETSP0103 /ASSEMBLY_ACC=CAM_ASM_000201 /LENGTH=514 /DNA_ID=CAMNT_0001598173 /DNA_START=60 /DNA_END=1604 /DNA_ORIENTATION=-
MPLLFLIACLVDVLVSDSSDGIGRNNFSSNFAPPLIQRIIDDDLGAVYDLIAVGENPNVSEKPSGWTPLIYAASKGDAVLANALLLAGADVNTGCTDGWTPLMFASVHGKVSVIQVLLEHGANIHQVSHNGATALGCAKLGGFMGAVDAIDAALRTDKLNEIFCDKSGREAVILSASHTGDVPLVEKLLLAGHSPNTVSAGGWTPLMLAAAADCLPCLQLLLEAGAVVDTPDNDGWTALMFCAHAGHSEGARLLAAASADVLRTNNDGYNSLQLARAEGHGETFHTLVDASFCREMAGNHVSRMMEMIEDGVGVNYMCASVGQYTPLIVAVKAQDEAAVRELLADKTIDVDAVEQDQWSALMFAALRESVTIVRLLLQRGASRELLTSQGYSVIRLARLHNHDNDVMLGMLENGVDFTHSPSVYSSMEEVKGILKKPADDGADKDGELAEADAIRREADEEASGGWAAVWSNLKRSGAEERPAVQHYRASHREQSQEEEGGGLVGSVGKALGWW